jgi:hypothetical protein
MNKAEKFLPFDIEMSSGSWGNINQLEASVFCN